MEIEAEVERKLANESDTPARMEGFSGRQSRTDKESVISLSVGERSFRDATPKRKRRTTLAGALKQADKAGKDVTRTVVQSDEAVSCSASGLRFEWVVRYRFSTHQLRLRYIFRMNGLSNAAAPWLPRPGG